MNTEIITVSCPACEAEFEIEAPEAGKVSVEKPCYNFGEVVPLLEKILTKLEEIRCGLIDIEIGVEKL